MQDQPSTCDDNGEPQPRPGTIPDDFLWDAEAQAWYPPGTPSHWDSEAFRRDLEAIISHPDFRGGTFTRDELFSGRPPERPQGLRKSRRTRVKRDTPDQLSLFGDDDTVPAEEPPMARDADDDGSAEELL